MAEPLRYNTKQVHYLDIPITFATPAATVIGKIPKGSTILKPLSGVQVNTVFNAATTNTLHIGESSPTDNDDLYATGLLLGTATFVPIDEAVNLTVTADTTLTCTYNQTGTAASAGAGRVVIAFIPPDPGQ